MSGDYTSRLRQSRCNNRLESHVWSQISGKPVERKNLNFFEATGKFPYFDMLKNGSHGSNRLGVRKSFETRIVRVPKQIQESQQLRC